jgi:hypothetical protein
MAANWDITRAPLSADEVKPAGMIIRWLAGAAMVSYSVITTVIIFGWFLSPVLKVHVQGINLAYVIGLVFSIGVTIAEWASADDAPVAHWIIVLIADTPFTAYQTYVWLRSIYGAHWGELDRRGIIVLIGLSVLIGVLFAKLGEWLLVRRGRKIAPKAVAASPPIVRY